MAAASLIASPTLVVVDRKAGERKGVTQITYEADDFYGRPYVWERVAGEPWSRVRLEPPRIVSSSSGNPERDGAFSRTLQPGQAYQVVMYHFEYIDPNVLDPNDPLLNLEQRPDASGTALAVLKDPERRDLIRSEDQNVGGTWFRKVATTVVPTSSILQVSNLPPFRDADGMFRFLSPQSTVFDLVASTQHDAMVEPLLPGN